MIERKVKKTDIGYDVYTINKFSEADFITNLSNISKSIMVGNKRLEQLDTQIENTKAEKQRLLDQTEQLESMLNYLIDNSQLDKKTIKSIREHK